MDVPLTAGAWQFLDEQRSFDRARGARRPSAPDDVVLELLEKGFIARVNNKIELTVAGWAAARERFEGKQ